MALTSEQLIAGLSELARGYMDSEQRVPVRPPVDAETLRESLDLALGASGCRAEELVSKLRAILEVTPTSSTTRFFNQLFGGRDHAATLAEMLTALTNTSMYTYKVAGPHVLIEQEVLSRMAARVGFHQGDGAFTPGGSMSNLAAMLVARNEAAPNIREEGMSGPPMRVYVSAEGHYSVPKAAGILGIGRGNVRPIDTDDQGCMEPSSLRNAIEQDQAAGFLPMMIVATAGTTVEGAYDPLREVGAVAREHGLWFHIDGSFGGSALLSRVHRDLLEGCDEADSFTWDAHKLMGVPLTCSVVLLRNRGMLQRHLDEAASYLFQGADDDLNPGVRSLQCGRRNDALKLWAAWQYHGDEGYERRIDHLFDLTQHAVGIIRSNPALTLTREPQLVNVCFEVEGKSSEAICDVLTDSCRAMVGYGIVAGRRVIRVVFANAEMTTEDVDVFFRDVLDVSQRLPAGSNGVAATVASLS